MINDLDLIIYLDVGILGYILIYGLLFYTISDEEDFQMPKNDLYLIKKVGGAFRGGALLCVCNLIF